MTLPKDVAEVLALTYYTYYGENSPTLKCHSTEVKLHIKEEALKILRIMGFKSRDNKLFLDDIVVPDPYEHSSAIIDIGTVAYSNISFLDMVSFEDVLNSSDYVDQWQAMSPLFDCIGWVIADDTGKVKINFIGSAIYDPWKDIAFDISENPLPVSSEYASWKDDIDPEELNWKQGLAKEDLDWKTADDNSIDWKDL